MTDRKRLFKLSEQELYQLLLVYFPDEVESGPLNAQAFVNMFFNKYEIPETIITETIDE